MIKIPQCMWPITTQFQALQTNGTFSTHELCMLTARWTGKTVNAILLSLVYGSIIVLDVKIIRNLNVSVEENFKMVLNFVKELKLEAQISLGDKTVRLPNGTIIRCMGLHNSKGDAIALAGLQPAMNIKASVVIVDEVWECSENDIKALKEAVRILQLEVKSEVTILYMMLANPWLISN